MASAAGAGLARLLEPLAEAAAEAAGMGFVLIDLHRPAWNDFETVAVAGSDRIRAALSGTTTQWVFWEPKMAPEFTRSGCQHVGPGGFPGTGEGSWANGEVLFTVLRSPDGDVVGMLRAGSPLDGMRPGDSRLEQLARHGVAAAGIVAADTDARAHADVLAALAGLAEHPHAADAAALADWVCGQVTSRLGFGRVAALYAERTGLLRPLGSRGWQLDRALFDHPWLSAPQLGRLLTAGRQQAGCVLLEREEAVALLDLRVPLPPSRTSGAGPLAWRDHWLLAPIAGSDGTTAGVLWAAEPDDRLLPSRHKLLALAAYAHRLAPTRRVQISATPPQDELTGLPSRAALAERLRHALSRNRRASSGVAVLFLDLDRFAAFNQRQGHETGDRLLQRIAARIDQALRPSDTVARFGGDEFVVVCEDVGGPESALEVAERLRAAVAEPVEIGVGPVRVTVSIGVAVPDHPDRGADELLQAADRAMYEVKAAGRNGTRLAAPGASL